MEFNKSALVLSCLAICSCASTPPFHSSNGGIIDRSPVISVSERTQRNLNVPWSQRRYLSGTKDFVAQIDKKQQLIGHASRHGLIQRRPVKRVLLVEKKKPSIDHSAIVVASAEPSHHPVAFTLTDFNDVVSEPLSETRISDLSVVYTVPFARRLEVLGPKGRSRTSAIAHMAKQSDRVILQGVVSDESHAGSSMDRLAIGRSLSIRKFLSQQGVQRNKFTILNRSNEHFRPEKKDGNYVEVRFDA